jgi:hypothetical protein
MNTFSKSDLEKFLQTEVAQFQIRLYVLGALLSDPSLLQGSSVKVPDSLVRNPSSAAMMQRPVLIESYHNENNNLPGVR